MMSENALVNTLYNPNDRLGVELLGSSAWNNLKRMVVNISKSKIRYAPVVTAAAKRAQVAAAGKRAQAAYAKARANAAAEKKAAAMNAANQAKLAALAAAKSIPTAGSPIVNELMGFNDAAGVALLGSTWSNLKDTVTSATHTALNVGKQIPITSGLVDTLRDVGSYFKWGSKASSETDSAIDAAAKAIKANKIKTALILGGVGIGAAFLIYYMGKKK